MHTKKEAPGYQPVVAGAVLHLLGLVHAATRQQPFEEDTDKAAQLMKEAMLLLRARVEERISMETVATTLHVSYAWFRKTFRQYTGMPPRQYFIQLKIEKARLLLNDTNRSVKEIAYDLNFDYPNHFSKLFKAKTGLSPEQYRKKYVQEN
jgi:transcriptional regulator GlxA family with amidase domain